MSGLKNLVIYIVYTMGYSTKRKMMACLCCNLDGSRGCNVKQNKSEGEGQMPDVLVWFIKKQKPKKTKPLDTDNRIKITKKQGRKYGDM